MKPEILCDEELTTCNFLLRYNYFEDSEEYFTAPKEEKIEFILFEVYKTLYYQTTRIVNHHSLFTFS